MREITLKIPLKILLSAIFGLLADSPYNMTVSFWSGLFYMQKTLFCFLRHQKIFIRALKHGKSRKGRFSQICLKNEFF
jgi:hypothetical protein